MCNSIDIQLEQIASDQNLVLPTFYPYKLQLLLTNFLSILSMESFHKKDKD